VINEKEDSITIPEKVKYRRKEQRKR